MLADLAFRLRWWWRVKRGRCPMGPPPPCPEPEEFVIDAVYECRTFDNEKD